MFSDPWIIGGAAVMLTIIGVAAAIRLYNRIKTRAEGSSKKKPA